MDADGVGRRCAGAAIRVFTDATVSPMARSLAPQPFQPPNTTLPVMLANHPEPKRRAVPGHWLLGLLATAPAAVPGIVLGVALFIAYTTPPFRLYGTLWILLLAFLMIEMPPAYQQMQAAFQGLNPELEEASRILGAGRLRSLAGIVAPLPKSSVATMWCFVFIGTIRELSVTILLTTSNTKLISMLIYDLSEGGQLGGIAVLGLVLMAVTAVVVIAANRLANVGAIAPGR